jgi:hypothetical protein
MDSQMNEGPTHNLGLNLVRATSRALSRAPDQGQGAGGVMRRMGQLPLF